MLPAAFVFLERLPLLSSGKIDRCILPAPKLTEEETFVAPRLLIHQQLVQIWQELLDVYPIGIRDNFFYLGGHSLLAARLVDRIKHVFGKSITLSAILSGPTIEQLAETLQQQENSDARTSVLPIRVSGSKRPFFFLHGDWTGGAFYCFTLARALGPDQPFYVLEPYKFSGLQNLPSFETVAATHIEALRAIQPEGPYLLGGFCNGGLLAYEMARQLEATGERVDFLALIAPSAPVQYEPLRALSKHMSKLLRLGVNSQAHLFLRVRHALRHVYRTVRPSGERVQDFDKLLVIDPRLQRMFPPVEALYNDYVNVFNWVVSRYETGIYPGKITFFWASEEPGIENTWSPVTEAKDRKEIESHIVQGTHMSCLTEHIQDLAECLSTCLSRLQEEALNQPVEATMKNALVKTYTNVDEFIFFSSGDRSPVFTLLEKSNIPKALFNFSVAKAHQERENNLTISDAGLLLAPGGRTRMYFYYLAFSSAPIGSCVQLSPGRDLWQSGGGPGSHLSPNLTAPCPLGGGLVVGNLPCSLFDLANRNLSEGYNTKYISSHVLLLKKNYGHEGERGSKAHH